MSAPATDLRPGVHAEADPHRPAVIEHPSGRVMTYAELEDRSRRLAGRWYAEGLRPGDHVAVVLDNRPDYYVAAWAAQRSGLFLTPVNTHLGDDEASFIIDDCGAKVVVTAETFAAPIDDAPLDAAHETEGAWMFYSSGTTGRPKGIVPPARHAPFGTGIPFDLMLQGLYGFRPGIRYLCPAPLYHAAPLGWSMGTHRLGGTVVLLERFDARQALDAIERHRVTHAQFVPTHFVRMLKLPKEEREAADVSSLEVVVHAAAPCPPDVKDAMLDWLGPIVYEYYSASEGAGFCAIGPDEWRAHRPSVGKALLGVIHIVDDDGRELPVGEAGRVFFEGGNVWEYHGDPEKTAAARNANGWATVGDIGYVDEEGYLFLTDRASHTIISGGVNIYPREIEDVLVVHPSVGDAAVIGIPDTEMGERVLAVVEPADGVSASGELAEELRAWCRARLAGYKCPSAVDFVEALPRLPTGKVRKADLRSQYGSWSGRIDAR